MTQSETARPGAGAAAALDDAALDGLREWMEKAADMNEKLIADPSAATQWRRRIAAFDALRALAAPPAPACDCASCRAARENRSPYSCCPRRLTHGAFCICGATIAAAPPAPAPAGEALPYEAVSVNGRAMEWKGPLWDAIHEWADLTPTYRPQAVVAVERAVEGAMRLAAECTADARAREEADMLDWLLVRGVICTDRGWQAPMRSRDDVRAALRAAGEGRADG